MVAVALVVEVLVAAVSLRNKSLVAVVEVEVGEDKCGLVVEDSVNKVVVVSLGMIAFVVMTVRWIAFPPLLSSQTG